MFTNPYKNRRLTKSLAVAAVVAALGAPAAQAEEFVPGVTDFPSRIVERPTYVPGVTDFPSRLGEKAEAAARARLASAEAARDSSSVAADSRDIDWAAGGIGAGIGAAGMLLAVLAYGMRPRLRLARSH